MKFDRDPPAFAFFRFGQSPQQGYPFNLGTLGRVDIHDDAEGHMRSLPIEARRTCIDPPPWCLRQGRAEFHCDRGGGRLAKASLNPEAILRMDAVEKSRLDACTSFVERFQLTTPRSAASIASVRRSSLRCKASSAFSS